MLIVDTGVLVAVGDEADRYYKPCRDLLETDQGPLVTNALVVAETAYMLRRGLGGVAELALLERRAITLVGDAVVPGGRASVFAGGLGPSVDRLGKRGIESLGAEILSNGS